MRYTLLIFALLIGLAGCSTAEDPSGSEEPSGSEDLAADPLPVSVADFMIDPPELEVSGPTVAFTVTNDGPTPHNLTIRDDAGDVLLATEDLSVGDSQTISAELEPGTYTMFCSLAGHESLGMSGTLTVGDG